MIGFLFEFKSCQMVPPSTVATLRTTEIIVAFVTQALITHKSPEIIDTLGAALVFLAAIALIFEKHIYDGLAKIFCICKILHPSHARLVDETDESIDY